METFVQGWGLTIVLCGFIVLVFLAGWWHVHAELAWVRALTDYLGEGLVSENGTETEADARPPSSLAVQVIRDESHAIREAAGAASCCQRASACD
jgi:hypothetical protein